MSQSINKMINSPKTLSTIYNNDDSNSNINLPCLSSTPTSSSFGLYKCHTNSKYQVDPRLSIHIDPRSHLEVCDKKHRYAKNLRIYFQEYIKIHSIDLVELSTSLSHDHSKWTLFERFFDWLDNSDIQPDVSTSVCV